MWRLNGLEGMKLADLLRLPNVSRRSASTLIKLANNHRKADSVVRSAPALRQLSAEPISLGRRSCSCDRPRGQVAGQRLSLTDQG